MSTLHTSGPWVHRTMTMARKAWAALGRSEIQIVAKNGNVIAAVWCADDRPGEKEANARLIAAAPDLLAALEAVTDDLERIATQEDAIGKVRHTARAALLKATVAP